jgi:penicillin-binding protein 1A
VVGVWVGNDDGRSMQEVSGGGLPAMMFKDFMVRSGEAPELAPLPDPIPDDVIAIPVAAVDGEPEPPAADRSFFFSLLHLFNS